MLSIEDLYREVGKNIFISPINTDNFRDNSVDLTASSFAWTNDGKYIYHEDSKKIIVPAGKTACVLTNESIYVSNKIGGTYHSRVSLVKRGFSHISTTLDPLYCGQSLIVLHNSTDIDLELALNERIVSVIFYFLNTPIVKPTLPTPPSHVEKIAEMDKEHRYTRWLDENNWVNNSSRLKAHFKEYEFESFDKKRKSYAQNIPFLKRIWSKTGYYVIKYAITAAILGFTLYLIWKIFTPNNNYDWAPLIIPFAVCVVGLIVGDIRQSKK